MPTTTKTVKPDGTGDYTTWAAWYAARKDSGGDEVGQGYGGGDTGAVDIASGTATSVLMDAAAGQMHNNRNAQSGCYITVGASTIGVKVSTFAKPVTVRGILCEIGGSNAVGFTVEGNGSGPCIVEDCMVRATANAAAGIAVKTNAGSLTGWTLRNCTGHFGGYAMSVGAIYLLCNNGTARSLNGSILSCSMDNFAGLGIYHYSNKTTNDADITVVETDLAIFEASGSGEYNKNGTGTFNLTRTYCAGSDGTADDEGGAGNLPSLTRASQWVTPGTDVTPASGGGLYDAGTTIGSFSDDALGTSRPQGSAWDIGSEEAIQASGPPVGTLCLCGVGR